MRGRAGIFGAALLAFGASALWRNSNANESPQSWVCVGEQAAGFAPDERTHHWRLTEFAAGKYVVSRVKGDLASQYPWEVRYLGSPESAVLAFCRYDFDQKIGDTACSSEFGVTFLFNRKSLRFTLISAPASYINNYGATGTDLLPPKIEIGKCSAV